MGEIYFVRHAQASFGSANYDRLSALGHRQAEWLGAHLAGLAGGFDRVVSGTLRRHRETLAGITRHLRLDGAAEDARLNEMAFFDTDRAYCAQTGTPPPEGAAALAAHFRAVMAAWERDEIDGAPESFTDFRARILTALADHGREGRRVLLVSSGGPLGIALRHVLGLDGAAMTEAILGTYNASYSRFAVGRAGLRLLQFNAVGHLEGSGHPQALTYL